MEQNRREFLRSCARNIAIAGLGMSGSILAVRRVRSGPGPGCGGSSTCEGCPNLDFCDICGTKKTRALSQRRYVWQIDPNKCTQCGRCATECVINPSAVKCVHAFKMCGYCNLCFGYFQPGASKLDEGAENQLCPTGAIDRTFIEEPYFQYEIDEDLCIGCAKCVKGCNSFGNGSLFLQVRHDICLNCNECAIAEACPSDAFRRVPSDDPYIWNGEQPEERA